MRLRTALAVMTLALATAAGCSTDSDEPGPVDGARDVAASGLLAEHGLDGLSAVQIVETLDASTAPRPLPMTASVNATQVVLADGDEQIALALPQDRFYLSVAPFVTTTHECFFHSLASCQGELVQEQVQVRITGADGATLVDEQVTTGTNGFTGFWLPRDITGTIQVEHEGRTGAVDFATDPESPTCLTGLQLSA